MSADTSSLIHHMAHNYRLCLADFPSELKPEHLDAPASERAALLGGLSTLHARIAAIYSYFADLASTDSRWSNSEYCYQAIEGPVKLLWALAVAGQIVQGPDGLELGVSRVDLDEAMKRCGAKNTAAAFEVLEQVGFSAAYRNADGLACPASYKQCAAVALRYPAHNDLLLRALAYYVARLPAKESRSKEKAPVMEVFMRADFRPLLPGYTYHIPHLPATEEEVTRTFDPETLALWRELTDFMASSYPQYRLYFHAPLLRARRWVAHYAKKDKDNDYGLWSICAGEQGLIVRIVFNAKTVSSLFERIDELSPHFQEAYLAAVACKDCTHCGKHFVFTRGDRVHRLCKTPWYMSPALSIGDIPDIKRLLDIRLAAQA